MFSSLIHLILVLNELCMYCVIGVGVLLGLEFFPMWISSCSSGICSKDFPFSIEIFQCPCQKSIARASVSIFGFTILFHSPVNLLLWQYYPVLITL